MTPRQFAALCRRLSDTQRAHWQRTALLASLIANANRDPKKKKAPFTLDDFMPKSADAPTQSPEQQAGLLRIAAAYSRIPLGG